MHYIRFLLNKKSQAKFESIFPLGSFIYIIVLQERHILAQWNMVGHELLASEPIGNLFYLHALIFEIPKQHFIIKPPAWWGADVSIEMYELLLLFSIITPWLDDALWNSFPVILKITSSKLCKPVHDIINYPTFIYPIESEKCGKKGKKIQQFGYVNNENSFFDEIKGVFHSFWRTIIWCKNKQ